MKVIDDTSNSYRSYQNIKCLFESYTQDQIDIIKKSEGVEFYNTFATMAGIDKQINLLHDLFGICYFVEFKSDIDFKISTTILEAK